MLTSESSTDPAIAREQRRRERPGYRQHVQDLLDRRADLAGRLPAGRPDLRRHPLGRLSDQLRRRSASGLCTAVPLPLSLSTRYCGSSA